MGSLLSFLSYPLLLSLLSSPLLLSLLLLSSWCLPLLSSLPSLLFPVGNTWRGDRRARGKFTSRDTSHSSFLCYCHRRVVKTTCTEWTIRAHSPSAKGANMKILKGEEAGKGLPADPCPKEGKARGISREMGRRGDEPMCLEKHSMTTFRNSWWHVFLGRLTLNKWLTEGGWDGCAHLEGSRIFVGLHT